MMLRSLSMAMLAVSLTTPAFAQQPQQDARQQVEAWISKWVDAYNKGDAKAVLAMNDPNACTITTTGMACGQKIEQVVLNVMKMGPRFTMTVNDARPIGRDGATAAGSYRVTYSNNPAASQIDGNWLRVFQRQGNEWKSVASSFTPTTPPAPAVASGAQQPTTGTSTPPPTSTSPAGPQYDPKTGTIK